MKSAEHRLKLHGEAHRLILFASFFFALVAATAVFFLRVKPVQPGPADHSSNGARTLERRLPSGDACRVTLHGPIGPDGRFLYLSNLEASINDQAVHVPAECFTDLRDVEVVDGIAFAGTVEQLLLFLPGGQGTNAWQARLRIHDAFVASRELSFIGGIPVETRYPPPFKSESFTLPPKAIEEARKLQKAQTQ